jgi:hypothetical protein
MQTLPGGVAFETHDGALRIAVSAPRAPAGALSLILFGAVAVALVTLSALAVMPTHTGDGAGTLAIVLFSAVALPVAAFGAVFIVIGIAALGTARSVHADAGGLRVRRSFGGVATGEWEVPRDRLLGVEVRAAPKYQNVGAHTVRMRVVAMQRGGRVLTLADALYEDGAVQLRQVLAEALELGDPPAPGVAHDAP